MILKAESSKAGAEDMLHLTSQHHQTEVRNVAINITGFTYLTTLTLLHCTTGVNTATLHNWCPGMRIISKLPQTPKAVVMNVSTHNIAQGVTGSQTFHATGPSLRCQREVLVANECNPA